MARTSDIIGFVSYVLAGLIFTALLLITLLQSNPPISEALSYGVFAGSAFILALVTYRDITDGTSHRNRPSA